MPEPIGVAEVEVRAKLDKLDADLQSVKDKMDKLDQSTQSTDRHVAHLDDTLDRVANKFELLFSSLPQRAGAAFEAMGNSAKASVEAPFKAISDKITSMFDEQQQQIDKFVGIIHSSAQAGLAPDVFQRLTKSADQLKLSATAATTVMENFARATQEQLGGSSLDRTLVELANAGNITQKAGIQAYNAASSTEERFKATVQIMDEMVQKGNRLAALRLGDTFLPPEIAQRMRTNSAFMDNWLNKVKEIKQNDLISDTQLLDAAELTRRMKEATDQWNKAWDFSTKISTTSTTLYRIWVNIVEKAAQFSAILTNIPSHIWANIVEKAVQLFGGPNTMVQGTGRTVGSPQEEIAALMKFREMPRLGDLSGQHLGPGLEEQNAPGKFVPFGIGLGKQTPEDLRQKQLLASITQQYSEAVTKLSIAMSEHTNIEKAAIETEKALGDSSKASADLLDSFTIRLERNIAAERARAGAIGQGLAVEAKLRVEEQLRASAELKATHEVEHDPKMILQDISVREKKIEALVKERMATDAVRETVHRLSGEYADALTAAEQNTIAYHNLTQKRILDNGITEQMAAIGQRLLRLYPDIREGVKSLTAEEMRRLQNQQKMQSLQKDTLLLEMRLPAEEAAIASQLKDQWTTRQQLVEVLGSQAAKEIRLQDEMKRTQSIQFEYSKLALGLTEQQIQVVEELKGKFGTTSEGIANALKSPEASWIRFNQTLKQSRDLVVGFGTDILTSVAGSLRQGEKATVAFQNAMFNAIAKVEDQLIGILSKAALEQLVTPVLAQLIPAIAGSAATQTTAATTSGGILIAAGEAVAASMIAGATSAAGILASGGAAAGAGGAAAEIAPIALEALALQSGGVVPWPRAQQGIIIPTPPSGMGTGVPIIAHPGEEVVRADNPRHINNQRNQASDATPSINLTFHANGRISRNEIEEHSRTIADAVASHWKRNRDSRPKY